MGAVYTGAIELRRLVVRWSRTPSGGITEDFDAVSFHFAKLTGGAVDAGWLAADYAAVESAFDTLWTSVKPHYPPSTKLVEYRWYKDGPAFSPADRADGPANPATRTTARAVAGTSGTPPTLPPQIAWTVTKVVDIRKRWGRIYMPAPNTVWADVDGRLGGVVTSTLSGWFVTFFNTCRAAGKQPVVWSRGRSAYVSPKGTAIDAHAASAYEITSVQVDNLFDVMRSRRYSLPTSRSTVALT